jgi:hypothetical protein
LGSLLAAAAAAQAPPPEFTWRVPPLGAAEYRRADAAHASEGLRSAALAKAAPTNARLPDRYLHRLPPAPWVCQGELRPDQRALTGPVRDLRDVLRAIAVDIGNRGGVRLRLPRLLPFGDVVVSGTWSAMTPDGKQSLRATFQTNGPQANATEGRTALERIKQFCQVDASGTVLVNRRWDAAAGVVAAYDGAFDLVADEGDKTFRRIQVSDQWQLVAVRENQDFDFRKRVAAAIRDGTSFVRTAIDEQKSFLVEKGGDDRNYGSGRLALGLLTLLHGGVSSQDDVVQRGFAELKKRRPEDSYSVAAALMAMAALHTPAGEAARLRDGGKPTPPRPLPEKDHKVAAKWLAQLLENIDPRGVPLDVLRFNYVAGPRYDTSLQQYGLLGLWSAHVCGLEIPTGSFAKAGRQLLAVQAEGGAAETLRLVTHAQVQAAMGEAAPKGNEVRARRRGFAYQEPSEPPFGSMTSAGISGLLLARAGMVARDEVDRALVARIDDAVHDGYAWLAEAFSVRCNPGFAERADHHWYYWMYGLERSCELANIARLDGRDWYYEGGLQLLSQQQANGSFRAEHASTLLLDATAFAVLFLAKATAASPITGTGR